MNTRKQEGFTIIEVVLVLAIAGLIFLMVFIALPALQRNQRDTQRRNDLSRVQTAIQNFQTNSKGTLPALTTQAQGATFIAAYLTVGGDTFVDPNGTAYLFAAAGTPTAATYNAASPLIYARPGNICGTADGTLVTGQGARKVALQMRLEGGGVACVNN